MDNEKKIMFLQNMTHMALSHAEKTKNEPTGDGKMSHDKKMAFVTAMAKHGLEHFDNGGIAGFLGAGNSFVPTPAQINNGTNPLQIGQTYNNAQNSINSQQNVANTLNPGISQGAGSQNTLTNLYTNEANGVGPNPAQSMLNQATQQNIAQQAALAAGQRGAGANAGLIARQNAQQSAMTQQQASGQAATLEAQQQLAAQGALQNLANQQVTQGQGATNAVTNAQLGEQGIVQGANTAANNANVAMQSNLNNVNAAVAEGNQKANTGIIGGLLGAAGAIGASAFSKGGTAGKDGMHPHHKMISDMYYPMMKGGTIPGKASISHDDIKNDVVPAMMTKGEVVIDLDTLNDKGPIGKMARALKYHMEKKGKK